MKAKTIELILKIVINISEILRDLLFSSIRIRKERKMTTATQKKNEITQPQVYQIDYGSFFVESSDGLKLYKVNVDGEKFCSCPDYAKNSRSDPNYQCKHIRAVLDTDKKKIFKFESLRTPTKPKLADEFIKQIDGKDFVVYAGLLDLAHQKGLKSITVELLQFPTKENDNLAVCKATALSLSGEVYVDYGDASPQNCNTKVSRHLIQMASTRAKARALRDYTNVGMTALEELGEISDVIGDGNGNNKKTRGRKTSSTKAKTETKPPEPSPTSAKKEPAQATTQNTSESSKVDTKPRMSEAQKRAVQNLAKRRGISEEQLEKLALEKYNTDLENLTSSDAANFIRHLQQAS